MGGSRPTFATFSSSRSPGANSNIEAASQQSTVLVQVFHDASDLLNVPPGIEANFAIFHDGAWEPASVVVNVSSGLFRVFVPVGGVTLERVRYVESLPQWFNVDGGRLLSFDVALPFP